MRGRGSSVNWLRPRRVPAPPGAGFLFFACPKKRNQKKRHPTVRAARFASGPRVGCRARGARRQDLRRETLGLTTLARRPVSHPAARGPPPGASEGARTATIQSKSPRGHGLRPLPTLRSRRAPRAVGWAKRSVPTRLGYSLRTPRILSTAPNTASAVAGARSVGIAVPSPQAATASRIACSTEIASISGGSPTALER